MNNELFYKISNIIRTSVLVIVMIVLTFFCVIRLLQIQIIEAGRFANQTRNTSTAEQIIPAARGRILDSRGRFLNDNQIVYKVILQRAFLPFGQENEIIAGVLDVLIKHEHEWIDNIPILQDDITRFKNVPEEDLDRFKTRLGLNYDATVENCIGALAENYKIDTEKYDGQMVRFIGGVRYEMEFNQHFSFQNRYVFAEDVSLEVIIELKEKSIVLRGVDIAEEAIRLYRDSTVLPHVRGRINAINEQQYESLKDSGYNLNDVIGFFGLEQTMESTMRGENGIRETTRDSSWEIISDKVTKEVRAGNNIKLTIDSEFQQRIETILANHINWHNFVGATSRRRIPTDATAGSIVVLDVNTGAILAMANNPSYDLNDYVDLMLADAAGDPQIPNKPLLDRSAGHPYRPGSSFKTVTGTAGLLNGAVSRNSSIFCGRVYTRFADYRPTCTGFHGSVNSTRALYTSCNIYYYDVGWHLGINRLSGIAQQFGVGTDLNADFPMATGRMTTPEVYQELHNQPFTDGTTVQAAIGQSETQLTTLHMATVAMTIANNGVRYRPHLVESVWNYEMTELIHKTEPEIVSDMSTNEDGTSNSEHFKAIQDGMHLLGIHQQTGIYNFLPSPPAFKTGTPEIIPGQLYNSTVLGFYPFDNPQIAFAVVLEGGEWSSRAIRNIIDAYFYDHHEAVFDADGNSLHDWVRWTERRQPAPGRYGS
jgi:penicillin-binding protein 2